jgi:hypothetical protein
MKTICILFASCTIISLPAYSWEYTGNYENIPPDDENTIQTPAIIETVKVEARADFCMFLGSAFLLIVGGGGWSLDRMLARK